MPYQPGSRLPGERASRLGHLDVLKSDLVKKICENFESPIEVPDVGTIAWEQLNLEGATPLNIIFGVDGSLQIIETETKPSKTLAFVKTALLRLDQHALAKVDKEYPHPHALKDILAEAAIYHATVFPLRYVSVGGMSVYDAVRHTIFESLKDDSLKGEPFETLKWIAYEKWSNEKKSVPNFECPHCKDQNASLPFDADKGTCGKCGKELLLSDMLGFHQEMTEDAAPNTIATSYMLIHETLLLFTGIRIYWDKKRDVLKSCLFIKDGPLSIRAQYSKLVNPIRRFLAHAAKEGCPINLVGQEKTGTFVEHLQLIGRNAPDGSVFVPSNDYVRQRIQFRGDEGAPYGKDTNYGSKVFFKVNGYSQMVLSFPTGLFIESPTTGQLLGFKNIMATLPTILSSRFEGGLLPVELANGVASLSTYPSAQVLRLFSEAMLAEGK